MNEYPKINTIWKRDQSTHELIKGDYSCVEFEAIEWWHITEKIDGTNIRVHYCQDLPGSRMVEFKGKTDNAELPLPLIERLDVLFPIDKMRDQFNESKDVVLYGEGYGGKIQSGGKYRKESDFILFDALIDGYWLEPAKVQILAEQLGIDCVPELGIMNKNDAINLVLSNYKSKIGDCVIEGIVARSIPLMLFRKDKTPIMWKLKVRDFKG